MGTQAGGHLSSLQRQDLEILKLFTQICERNGLRYFLAAGTLLGAVRHRGFIPWDDDVDVAMPRRDYDRFLEIADRELPEGYRLGTPRQREHVWIVATISARAGGFLRRNAADVRETGAWIDIMVLDGVPRPGIRREWHWYHYLALRALYQISHFDQAVDQKRARPLHERLIIWIARRADLQRFLDPCRVNARIERRMRRYDYDACEYVAAYCGIYRRKEIMKKDWFGEGRRYHFEDIRAVGPDRADRYLTRMYGDYRTPAGKDRGRHEVEERT